MLKWVVYLLGLYRIFGPPDIRPDIRPAGYSTGYPVSGENIGLISGRILLPVVGSPGWEPLCLLRYNASPRRHRPAVGKIIFLNEYLMVFKGFKM